MAEHYKDNPTVGTPDEYGCDNRFTIPKTPSAPSEAGASRSTHHRRRQRRLGTALRRAAHEPPHDPAALRRWQLHESGKPLDPGNARSDALAYFSQGRARCPARDRPQAADHQLHGLRWRTVSFTTSGVTDASPRPMIMTSRSCEAHFDELAYSASRATSAPPAERRFCMEHPVCLPNRWPINYCVEPGELVRDSRHGHGST